MLHFSRCLNHCFLPADEGNTGAGGRPERWDVHTHRRGAMMRHAIWNWAQNSAPCDEAIYMSAGIHPYYLTEQGAATQLEWLETALQDPRVIAVGEAGLDKSIDVPFQLQCRLFSTVARLASDNNLPLIIHAVKSSNEIIALKKELRPRNAWIIHGFRGKKELAQTYLQHGFYLSFGERYQEEALRAVPLERLFIETDESTTDVAALYGRAARWLNLPEATLAEAVKQNINKLFFGR